MLTTVREQNSDQDRPAVIDTLSPVSVIVPTSDNQTGLRRKVELTLNDSSAAPIPRARFPDALVFDHSPCPDETCQVGADSDLRPIEAILGFDVLQRVAVRLNLCRSNLQFLRDIGGTDTVRGRACEAIFPNVLSGGGTLFVSGTEINYPGRRVAIGACFAFSPNNYTSTTEQTIGVDAVFLLSTGVGITVISESTFERYRSYCATQPTCAEPQGPFPQTQLYLASGPLTATLATLETMALVGDGSVDRGPCTELAANHIMRRNGCIEDGLSRADCICDQKLFCSTGAAIELRRSVEVAIIPDTTPLLQALRDEVHPALADIDGLLGTNALAPISLDIDYPNRRIVARCDDTEFCTVRPEIRDRGTAAEITACPEAAPDAAIGPSGIAGMCEM